MRFVSFVLVMGCLSGCSLSVGAGASARLGHRLGDGGLGCDGFESCDVAYRQSVARAERCQAEDRDCEQVEADVLESYRVLRAQTLRELQDLRAEVGEAAEARREESEACQVSPPTP